MKNLKYSVPGQMVLLAKTHLTTAVVFMILFVMTVSSRNRLGDIIFGSLGILGYFLSIYSAAGAILSYDRLSISPLSPKPLKGVILPAFLTIASIVIIILYKLAWTYGSDGQSMTQIWSLIFNIISLLWVAPYQPLLGMENGYIELQGYLIIFILPIIASGLGYYAAYKGFDLSAKIHSLAYEKKQQDKDEF